MKEIYPLVFFLFFAWAASAQNAPFCAPKTFLKEISQPGQVPFSAGQTLCPAGDGNLYVVLDWFTDYGETPLIMKFAPTGEVLWSRLFFWDEYSYFPTRISHLVVDSDGMLVIAGGYYTGLSNVAEDFICRYDPVQDLVLWSKRFPDYDTNHNNRVLEKQPGGNYLLYRTLPAGQFGQETELLEINRQTGAVTGNARKIGWAEGTALSSIVAYQGALYAAGTQTRNATSNNPGDQLLCKMNLAGTQLIWAKLGPGIPETVKNTALLIDHDTLISLYVGRDTLPAGQHVSQYIYLQKTTLDGDPVWVRRYEEPDYLNAPVEQAALSIVPSADGYLLVGSISNGDTLNMITDAILVTDKAGHLQRTCRIPTPAPFQSAGYNGSGSFGYFTGDFATVLNESFYVTSFFLRTHDQFFIDSSKAILLKSDLALTGLDSCPFAPLGFSVPEWSLPQPTATPIALDFGISTATVKNFPTFTRPESIREHTDCARCDQPCGLVLSLGPDRTFFADTTLLLQAGPGYISYLWQDGSTAPDYLAAAGGAYWVEVRDACGFVQRDTIRLELSTTVCDQKELACIRWELLDIRRTTAGDLRFRVNVTNHCASALQQVSFELPAGLTAVQPVEQSTYTAQSGRSYSVRNPNFSPFYSIRFKASTGAPLSNEAADIFAYDLPGQAAPAYLHTVVKLADGSSYSALLNTFNCPPATAENRASIPFVPKEVLSPNPSTGTLRLLLPAWKRQDWQVRILNVQGQVLQTTRLAGGAEQRLLQVASQLGNGLYYLTIQGENAAPLTLRFVLER